MRDWQAFVRSHFKLPNLAPEREARIVRELAAQLEDFYREAIAGGSSEAEADAHACRQIRDWDRMAQDVWMADRRNARSSYERIIEPRLAVGHTGRWVVASTRWLLAAGSCWLLAAG